MIQMIIDISVMQWIANLSSIITCFLFVLYIIGHIWKIIISLKTKCEKFQVQNTEENAVEEYENVIEVDKTGKFFSINSIYGIKRMRIFKVIYEAGAEDDWVLASKQCIVDYVNLNSYEPIYIKCDLGEILPIIQIEIERVDYIKAIFDIMVSGKTGNIITYNFIKSENYKYKLSFKSFLYYLCS